MINSNFSLAKRYGHDRPGLSLVAIAHAALPVTLVTCEVLAQERKPLPLLDEYLLRLTEAGVRDLTEIADTLGLELSLIESTAVGQMSAGTVIYDHSSGKKSLTLTEYGKRVTQELAAVVPIQQQLKVTFDRMTWEVADYPKYSLFKRKQADREGIIMLPPAQNTRIGHEDVSSKSLNQIIGSGNSHGNKIEVLSVRKVRPSSYVYLPVKLLIFADKSRGEVQLGVVVEDSLSREHGHALERTGGADALGIKVEEADMHKVVSEFKRLAPLDPSIASIISADDAHSLAVVGLSEKTPKVQRVEFYEHPVHLSKALNDVHRRLLIASPWISDSVVGKVFIDKLEALIGRGVKIYISCSLDEDGSDQSAIERVRRLAQRYPESFFFSRSNDRQINALIFDNSWINTSYDWLSQSGDRSRTYRADQGFLVSIGSQAESAFSLYLDELFEEN